MLRKTFIACVQALFLIAWCHLAVAQSNIIGNGVFGDVKHAATPPTVTYQATNTSPSFPTGSSTLNAAISTGTASATRFAIAVIEVNSAVNAVASTVTFQPSGFANVSATVVQSGVLADGAAVIAYAVLPNGTNVDVAVQWSASIFGNPIVSIYTADSSLLNSQTPVTAIANNAGSTTASMNVATLAGGFVVTGGSLSTGAGTAATLTGTETYTADFNALAGGVQTVFGHANGISANASSNVLYTFVASGRNTSIAAAWR